MYFLKVTTVLSFGIIMFHIEILSVYPINTLSESLTTLL